MSIGATIAVISMLLVALRRPVRPQHPQRGRASDRRRPPRRLFTVLEVVIGLAYLLPLLWIVLTSLKTNAQVLRDPERAACSPRPSTPTAT